MANDTSQDRNTPSEAHRLSFGSFQKKDKTAIVPLDPLRLKFSDRVATGIQPDRCSHNLEILLL